MELDISRFFKDAAPMDYSASVAEIGADAGQSTWRAACDDSAEFMLLDTAEKREAFDTWARGFGAWSAAELAAHTPEEANALLLQFIAGDTREADIGPDSTRKDWRRYARDSEAGRVAGRIFRGSDGLVYFYIGD